MTDKEAYEIIEQLAGAVLGNGAIKDVTGARSIVEAVDVVKQKLLPDAGNKTNPKG